MSSKTIANLWTSYERLVVPKSAGTVQRNDTQYAFFAGAYALLIECAELGHDSVTEDDGAAQLQAWKDEIEKFVRTVAARRRNE